MPQQLQSVGNSHVVIIETKSQLSQLTRQRHVENPSMTTRTICVGT